MGTRFGARRPIGAADDPVAVIELAQMVRIEAIAHVGGQPYAPGRGRMRQASHNRAEAIGVFPGNFSASFQFSHAHPLGLEDDVLAIIEFPVAGKDSTFTLEW